MRAWSVLVLPCRDELRPDADASPLGMQGVALEDQALRRADAADPAHHSVQTVATSAGARDRHARSHAHLAGRGSDAAAGLDAMDCAQGPGQPLGSMAAGGTEGSGGAQNGVLDCNGGAGWLGRRDQARAAPSGRRGALMKRVRLHFPPSLLLPERRLEILMEQALQAQVRCSHPLCSTLLLQWRRPYQWIWRCARRCSSSGCALAGCQQITKRRTDMGPRSDAGRGSSSPRV